MINKLLPTIKRSIVNRFKWGLNAAIFLVASSGLLVFATPIAMAAPEYADLPLSGTIGNGPLWVSPTGRYVVVASNDNLIPDGGGAGSFLRDRLAQTTIRLISGDPNDVLVTGLSDDLRFVVILTTTAFIPEDTNSMKDVYVYDRTNNIYELVSKSSDEQIGNGMSYTTAGRGAISADGRFIVFISYATNLANGLDQNSPSNGGGDIFIRDRQANTTKRVSSDALGNAGNNESAEAVISADGSTVIFSTHASNISGVAADYNSEIMAYTMATGDISRVSVSSYHQDETQSANATVSADGRYVTFLSYGGLVSFSDDGKEHYYHVDRQTGNVSVVDKGQNGQLLNLLTYYGMIDGDGQRIVFSAYSNIGLELFYWDASTGYCTQFASGVQGTFVSRDGLVVAGSETSGHPSRTGVWTLPPVVVVPEDSAAPTLGTFVWGSNPKSTNGSTSMTISATDNGTGISSAEYFIGDTDPGRGNGATMTIVDQQTDGSGAVTAANLTTTFGADFPTGVYKISARAKDVAGNWSEPVSDYLVVYDVNGPKFTGKKAIVPSITNGDVLPGLSATGQTDKATFGFSVKYNNNGQISNNSDLQFTYITGSSCNNPRKANNCHSMSLNATHIDWLTSQGTNNSIGIFQGTATVKVDGATSTVLFRVTGRDGERVDPTATDQFQLQVFNSTDNPNTATPLYVVNSADIARGNIKITYSSSQAL